MPNGFHGPDQGPAEGEDLPSWRLRTLEEGQRQLWDKKASIEQVVNIKEEIRLFREQQAKENDTLNGKFSGLQRTLIAAAVSWAVGSGTFLIAVLELTK